MGVLVHLLSLLVYPDFTVILVLIDIGIIIKLQFAQVNEVHKLHVDFVFKLNEAIKNNHYYVSGIIHDLRNPISCVQLFFELLESQLPANAL